MPTTAPGGGRSRTAAALAPCTSGQPRPHLLRAPDQHRGLPWQRFELRRVEGAGPMLVDAAPVQAHLDVLTGWGLPVVSIAAAAGMSDRTVQLHIARRRATIHRHYADALLAVGYRPHPAQRTVLAVGARRRSQALAAAGWALSWQAEQLGLSVRGLNRAIDGPTVSAVIHRRLCALFDECAHREGPSARARTWARNRGWATAAQWDGEDLDNPDARSDLDFLRPAASGTRVNVEDVRWLMSPNGGSLTLQQVTERLGIDDVETVRRALARASTRQRLSWAQVEDIRARAATGTSKQALADEYGVARSLVSRIVARRIYVDEAPVEVSA